MIYGKVCTLSAARSIGTPMHKTPATKCSTAAACQTEGRASAGAPWRTYAGDKLHICIGVAQAEPAAIDRFARLRPLRRWGVLGIYEQLPPHEVAAVELAGALPGLHRSELYVAPPLQLTCRTLREGA